MESARQASRPMWGLSASAARWAVASVAATALVVGAFVVAPLIDHKAEPATDQLRITPAQQAPIQLPATAAPVTGGTTNETTARENTPLPQAEPRTPAVNETAERRHASPDAARHDMRKETRPTPQTSPAPLKEPASEGNDMAPASKQAEPTTTTSAPALSSSKPDGRPKVVDSAAKVRLQLELPH